MSYGSDRFALSHLRYHWLPWRLETWRVTRALLVTQMWCALPQCLAMVELTLVGWKDPVVLDLPTTAREL